MEKDHHIFLRAEVRLAQHEYLDAQQPNQRILADLHSEDFNGFEVDVLRIEEEKCISDEKVKQPQLIKESLQAVNFLVILAALLQVLLHFKDSPRDVLGLADPNLPCKPALLVGVVVPHALGGRFDVLIDQVLEGFVDLLNMSSRILGLLLREGGLVASRAVFGR